MILKKYKNKKDDVRYIRKFALIPEFIDRSWIWLQFYYVKQRYSVIFECWITDELFLNKPL